MDIGISTRPGVDIGRSMPPRVDIGISTRPGVDNGISMPMLANRNEVLSGGIGKMVPRAETNDSSEWHCQGGNGGVSFK